MGVGEVVLDPYHLRWLFSFEFLEIGITDRRTRSMYARLESRGCRGSAKVLSSVNVASDLISRAASGHASPKGSPGAERASWRSINARDSLNSLEISPRSRTEQHCGEQEGRLPHEQPHFTFPILCTTRPKTLTREQKTQDTDPKAQPSHLLAPPPKAHQQ